MAIQFPQFNRISFDEANPFLTGMQKTQDLRTALINNQINQAKAQYALPMAEQDLQKAKLINEFYPQLQKSLIGLQGAEAGLAGSEASKNQFMTANPQYISPEGALMTLALNKQRGVSGGGSYSTSQPTIQPGLQGQATQGIGDSSGYSYDKNGNNIVASPQEVNDILNRHSQSNTVSQLSSSIANAQQNQGQPLQSQYSPDAFAFNPPNLPSPTGNQTADNMYFKHYGMSPVVQAQLELSKTQAQKYQDQNIERNKQFNNEAQFANQSTIDAHKFLDALDRSTSLERGAIGGKGPAVRDAAQEMDAYGNNMAASATKLFDEGRAVHKSDIELQQSAKPNRKQNKDVSFDLAQGVIAKNDRLKERQQFYAQGTQLGLKPEIMDAMFNRFETERPYIDPITKIPNDSYKGTSKDYLKPEAVNAFLNGSTYNPANQKSLDDQNWTAKDLKAVTKWAKDHNVDPAGYSKQQLFKIAQNEKIPMSKLKMEFRKMGAPI